MLKNSNCIIFVGGRLTKYKYQNFNYYINCVTKVAERDNIPFALNAVGVEGISLKDTKCKLMRNALNMDCVKIITTRDDVNTLLKYVDNSNDKILG